MPVQEMFDEFRSKFPDITEKADAEHIPLWDKPTPQFAFEWFESLAKAINREIAHEIPVTVYQPVFEYLRLKYLMGDDADKECIDVSFVENLFWQIKSEKAEPYWQALPSLLQDLYIKFHGCAPD